MRLTREALLKVARDTATQRARVSRRIICIYLTGSVLAGDPLLGGTADIDLIIVHDSEPVHPREMVRLTDEVHLDIGHYSQSVFHQPRHLRADPWLGPFIYSKPLVLHDTNHWFDFMQAATGAQFYQPDYTLQRATTLAEAARQSWMKLKGDNAGSHPQQLRAYLHAIEDAGNAIASLTGDPLTERRFFTRFPQRAQAIRRPEISARLVEMITSPNVQMDPLWEGWTQNWNEALAHAKSQEFSLPGVHPARRAYYVRAAGALWAEHPIAALWILLRSWTDAALQFDPGSTEMENWESVCQVLHLDENHFSHRADELDNLIDTIEETLDDWAKSNGISNA
jgi:hypothetical protein